MSNLTLVQLAQADERGDTIEIVKDNEWIEREYNAQPYEWFFNGSSVRIKPALRLIDMSCLVGSDVDCILYETQSNGFQTERITFANEGNIEAKSTPLTPYFRTLRPRLNHKMVYTGQELPKGLEVKYYYFHKEDNEICTLNRLPSNNNHLVYAFEVRGCKDGYTFGGES